MLTFKDWVAGPVAILSESAIYGSKRGNCSDKRCAAGEQSNGERLGRYEEVGCCWRWEKQRRRVSANPTKSRGKIDRYSTRRIAGRYGIDRWG